MIGVVVVVGEEKQETGVGTTTQVGFRIMTIPNTVPLTVALYYPTQSIAHKIQMGAFSPTLAINGSLPVSLKGLILLSHGSGGNELGHYNLAQALAKQGYLVAAPRHSHDNFYDLSQALSYRFFLERPKQLSRVLDALLADPDWKKKIPLNNIGAIGHSAGGASVLALVGGVPNPLRIVEHCSTSEDDVQFCEIFAKQSDFFSGKGAMSEMPDIDFNAMDARVRAAIVMAPQALVFMPDSLKNVTAPLKIYVAEHDVICKGKYHGSWLHAQIPHAEFDEVKNAGHFAFIAPPNRPISSDMPIGDINENPSGFDRVLFHKRLESEIVAFFDQNFKFEGDVFE